MGEKTRIVKDMYACFAAGDLDGVLCHVDPAVVLIQDERLPWGGR
jgi:hypothetical protein